MEEAALSSSRERSLNLSDAGLTPDPYFLLTELVISQPAFACSSG